MMYTIPDKTLIDVRVVSDLPRVYYSIKDGTFYFDVMSVYVRYCDTEDEECSIYNSIPDKTKLVLGFTYNPHLDYLDKHLFYPVEDLRELLGENANTPKGESIIKTMEALIHDYKGRP